MVDATVTKMQSYGCAGKASAPASLVGQSR